MLVHRVASLHERARGSPYVKIHLVLVAVFCHAHRLLSLEPELPNACGSPLRISPALRRACRRHGGREWQCIADSWQQSRTKSTHAISRDTLTRNEAQVNLLCYLSLPSTGHGLVLHRVAWRACASFTTASQKSRAHGYSHACVRCAKSHF